MTHKIVLSQSMLGTGLNEALNNNVEKLCEEFKVIFADVVLSMGEAPTVPAINEALQKFFPGQLKIIK